MGWFNYYGLGIIVLIMIPNIIYAIKNKNENYDYVNSRLLSVFEQIGRYGSIVFMIFNIPYLYFDFWFNNALIVYLAVNVTLLLVYFIGWAVLWNNNSKFKALLLSITPTIIFVFSGVMLLNIPLLLFGTIFGIFHIMISYLNTRIED